MSFGKTAQTVLRRFEIERREADIPRHVEVVDQRLQLLDPPTESAGYDPYNRVPPALRIQRQQKRGDA